MPGCLPIDSIGLISRAAAVFLRSIATVIRSILVICRTDTNNVKARAGW
jgi:hypothetical protein